MNTTEESCETPTVVPTQFADKVYYQAVIDKFKAIIVTNNTSVLDSRDMERDIYQTLEVLNREAYTRIDNMHVHTKR